MKNNKYINEEFKSIIISNIDKDSEFLNKSIKDYNECIRKRKELLEYNKQNLKIGDEVEYESKFWTIETFSASKTYAKLTAYKQQPVLANLVNINNFE